jgi:broad specificity phosphatase PhoE
MTSFKNTAHNKNRIFLIRHGETAWSKSGQHTGRTDIPLTSKGEAEAKMLAKILRHISFKKVFISPLIRVQRTCELADLRGQAELTEDLYEWDYGQYEGKTTPEIRKTHPNWNLFDCGVPHGETIEEVSKRADHILQRASEVDGDVALFSSGHFSRVLGMRWIGFSAKQAQFFTLSTASISILGYEHDWRAILSWNNVSHLE